MRSILQYALGLLLFVGTCASSIGQQIEILPRVGGSYTLNEGLMRTDWGGGGGGILRIRPLPWVYVQGGAFWGLLHPETSAVRKYRSLSWDCQLGVVPFKKVPVHFSAGPLVHRYAVHFNEVYYQGYLFIPALTNKFYLDGWSFGVGYAIIPQLEVHLFYETEPYFRYYRLPMHANYIRFQVNYSLPVWKWEWKKVSRQTAVPTTGSAE